MSQLRISFLILAICLLYVAEALCAPPYPQSSIITNINWAPVAKILRKAPGSDTWPTTWADDDSLYTVFGDGWGFTPKIADKLSVGFAKISGNPNQFVGVNIRSSTGEQTGGGLSGKKASGMLMVDGVLYMWVRNANNNGEQCQLAWSRDYAQSWTWSEWKFAELGYCVFLNFGKNYAGARDDYVYAYSPNTPSAYNETDQAILMRAPKEQIANRGAYEFFAGFYDNGNPVWTTNINLRQGIFTFPGGVNRMDVTYNVPLGRYLMVMRSRARAGGVNHFSIFDAPEPWGPWTTVYYTKNWEGKPLSTESDGWGESQHIPSKWISTDGTAFYLIFSGKDSFSVRKAELIVAPNLPIGSSAK